MSIPVHVSASQALARRARYSGPLPEKGLSRLLEFHPQGLEADLGLERDVAGQGWLVGRVSGRLQLECRSCQAPFAWSLDVPVRLALARDEAEEERLLESADPLLVEDDRLLLHQAVEDEVLLALPMLPRCPACENRRPPPEPPPEAEATRGGPLADLKNLSLKGRSPTRRK